MIQGQVTVVGCAKKGVCFTGRGLDIVALVERSHGVVGVEALLQDVVAPVGVVVFVTDVKGCLTGVGVDRGVVENLGVPVTAHHDSGRAATVVAVHRDVVADNALLVLAILDAVP